MKDLTIWNWIFYLRWHGFGASSSITPNGSNFTSILNDALKWAGSEKEFIEIPRETDHKFPHINSRLVGTEWKVIDGIHRSLEARSMLDVYYLQTGCARTGEATPDDIPQIMRSDWKSGNPNKPPLGEATCLWGEIDRISVAEAGDIGRGMLESWSKDSVRNVEPVDLGFGFVVFSADIPEEVLALLVYDSDDARSKAERLIHLLLPPLFLARLKGKSISADMEQALLPKAYDFEDKLIKELGRIDVNPIRLAGLEESSYAISRYQAKLAESISECEDKLLTLKVNTENLDRLLNDRLLVDQKTLLDSLLVAPVRIQREQIETTLNYLTITYTKAGREMQGIETMTRVRTARWERSITILFGLFVAFGVAQVFPEKPSWFIYNFYLWRLLVVAGTLTLVLLLSWWLYRKR